MNDRHTLNALHCTWWCQCAWLSRILSKKVLRIDLRRSHVQCYHAQIWALIQRSAFVHFGAGDKEGHYKPSTKEDDHKILKRLLRIYLQKFMFSHSKLSNDTTCQRRLLGNSSHDWAKPLHILAIIVIWSGHTSHPGFTKPSTPLTSQTCVLIFDTLWLYEWMKINNCTR